MRSAAGPRRRGRGGESGEGDDVVEGDVGDDVDDADAGADAEASRASAAALGLRIRRRSSESMPWEPNLSARAVMRSSISSVDSEGGEEEGAEAATTSPNRLIDRRPFAKRGRAVVVGSDDERNNFIAFAAALILRALILVAALARPDALEMTTSCRSDTVVIERYELRKDTKKDVSPLPKLSREKNEVLIFFFFLFTVFFVLFFLHEGAAQSSTSSPEGGHQRQQRQKHSRILKEHQHQQ